MKFQQNIYRPTVGDRVSPTNHGRCVGVVRVIAGRTISVAWLEGRNGVEVIDANDVFFLPTAKQIAEACADIQREWSPEERERRAGYKYRPAAMQTIESNFEGLRGRLSISLAQKLSSTDEEVRTSHTWTRRRAS